MGLQCLGFFSPYISSPLKMEQTSTSYIRAVPLPSSSLRAATDTPNMGTREGDVPQAVLDQSTAVGSPGKAQCEPWPRAGWVSSSEASSQTLPSGGCPPPSQATRSHGKQHGAVREAPAGGPGMGTLQQGPARPFGVSAEARGASVWEAGSSPAGSPHGSGQHCRVLHLPEQRE